MENTPYFIKKECVFSKNFIKKNSFIFLNEEKMLEIEKDERVRKTLQSLRKKSTQNMYKFVVKTYLQFLNSKKGLEREVTFDDVFQMSVDKIEQSIHDFYDWLRGHPVEGYEGTYISPRKKKPASDTSACVYAYSTLRGFFTRNGIEFSREFKGPNVNDLVPKAISLDRQLEFFRPDMENGGAFFDRELFRAFLAHLNLRDQAIALSLLSTSQDSGDLFKLNVGFVRRQADLKTKKPRERLYWEGTRRKTGVRFRVFFSKEATKAIRLYLETERKDAKDDEPLFTKTGNRGRMTPLAFADNCREVAIKMGFYQNGNGFQNPLRPKRMRHLFRTACDYAGIEEPYIHVFMGHKSSISARYMETPTWRLEQEYAKVERVLSVYGDETGIEIVKVQRELEEKLRKEKDDLQRLVNQLSLRNIQLQNQLEQVQKDLESLKRRWDHFSKYLDLKPEELEALSEIIRRFLQEKNRQRFEEQREQDRKWLEEHPEKLSRRKPRGIFTAKWSEQME